MIDPIPFFSGSYILPRTIIGAAFPISKKGLINLKKLTKQIISIALGAVTAASCGTMAFAADKTLNQDTPSGSSTVEYSEESTYTATIPAYIKVQKMSEDVDTNANSVTLRNVIIPNGKSLVGTVKYNGAVAEENNVKIPYKLATAEGDLTSGSTIITQTSGKSTEEKTSHFGAVATEKPKYSGYYTDTATFSFDEVGATNAFFEQIKANNYTLNIGKTKPEYVVAKFNKDFTKVTISKNGNDSDGLMKDDAFAYVNMKGITERHLQQTLKEAEVLDGVKNIGNLTFYDCLHLTDVNISNSVISIGRDAFSACIKLVNVNIPNGLTDIGIRAFNYCPSLKNIIIPSSVTSIGNFAFNGCYSLKSIEVAEDNSNYSSEDGVLFNKNKSNLICCPGGKAGEYTIPDFVTSMSSGAFASCRSITKVVIPNTIANIPYGAFSQCDALTDVVIPNSVTSIEDSAFNGCSSLANITIPSSVTNIGTDAFNDTYKKQEGEPFLRKDRYITLFVTTGSYAETWAKTNGCKFVAQ